MGGLRVATQALACALALSAVGAAAAQEPSTAACIAPTAPMVRTSLYFGMTRPNGGPVVTDLEWQLFLRDEITARFPEGLTVLDGRGQWRGASGRIDQEPSKVVLLTHPEGADRWAAVAAIIAAYRKAFDQEAVMWESERVCVAFQ